MRYLIYSIMVLSIGCASDYRGLHMSPIADDDCQQKIAPSVISTGWYNASVDVVGKHFSGLLLFKTMPDSSERVVFMNEVGVTFFDFGFSKHDGFTVYSIIHKMDKKPVVQTLRKDFALIMGLPFRDGEPVRYELNSEVYYAAKEKKETAYFITTKDCASLQRLEWASTRKRKVSVEFPGTGYPTPDTIVLTHHTFPMKIKLTRINKNDSTE